MTCQVSDLSLTALAFISYRDFASFRFLGVPYGCYDTLTRPISADILITANPPERWEYSSLYSGSQRSFNTTAAGPHCVQAGDINVSEDCLFLNVFTPYLPASTKTAGLKPVMFWYAGLSYMDNLGNIRMTSIIHTPGSMEALSLAEQAQIQPSTVVHSRLAVI